MAKKTKARAILFGTSTDCDVRGSDLESKGLEGISFILEYGGERLARKDAPARTASAAKCTGRGGRGVGGRDDVGRKWRRRSPSARIPLRLPRLPRPQRLDDPRRHLQRQPGVDAGGPGAAGGPAGSPDSGAGRHAGAGAARSRRGIASSGARRRAWRRSSTPSASWGTSSARRRSGPDTRPSASGHRRRKPAQAACQRSAVGDVVLLKASRAMALETILPELKG